VSNTLEYLSRWHCIRVSDVTVTITEFSIAAADFLSFSSFVFVADI
jgi:hypothetical protein